MRFEPDVDLHARLASATPDAWDALRAWMEEAPAERGTPAVLADIESALAAWATGNRIASAAEWTRIESGGVPPVWWPLVRMATIDEWSSLQPSAALRGIHGLRFGPRARARDLSPLADLPGLRELAIASLGAEGLDATPPLPHLERLSAAADGVPRDLAPRFPALRSLSLAHSGELTRLPELPATLTELDLSGCARLGAIDAIAACPALRSIDLHGCDALEDLSPLAHLPELSLIRVDARRSRSLVPAAAVTVLSDLRVGAGEATVDLRPFDGHTGLRLLVLDGCADVAGLESLHLPALEELHVVRSHARGLPVLAASPRLQVVDLESATGIHAVPPLAPGQVLALLRLVGMHGLDTVTPAAQRTVRSSGG